MRIKRVAAVASTALFGVSAATVALAAGGESETERELAKVRRATAKFHDVTAARAAGYAPEGPCVEAPGVGGMGVHFVNGALAQDPAVDLTRPEMLLYAPDRDGDLKLVGVEYFKVDADQDLATDEDRPVLFGLGFDGPMAGHGPGMPSHYDLHVWVWKHNPAGEFAQFNPEVRC